MAAIPSDWQETLPTMVFQQIEKIKKEYTDKYVMVDGKRPELARFDDLVGQVKTVNMSGRALVEFIDYHLNIGWFDIDLDYLKVVDKPKPKEKKPAAKKPAAKAPAKKQAADASGEKKLSPLEMARMQGAPGETKSEPKPAVTASAGPGKADRAKMSVADMLAAARGEKAAAAPKTAEAAPVEAPPAAPEPTAATGDVTKVDRSSMSVAEMIAYCREHDA